MYSIEQLPIKELSILLSGSQTDSQCRIERPVLDAVAHIEASYVADLLLNVELQSPKLTREYVKQLHSGDVSWKSTKGEYVSLKENFEFELLEELGLIFFEYDWLRVNTIHRIGNFFDEHTDETLKSIVRFACKLNDIISGGGELERLKFRLKENAIHKIIPIGYCFKNIKIDTNNPHDMCVQTLEISSHEIRCLISDYYWKKTVDISCEKWDAENYYTLTLAFNDLIFYSESEITRRNAKH